ncbi:hypothetical protein ILUMI_23132 [Ignelater luminosus]|uniref:Uncharacterized protein n=1 Tax=Ignelater luminosus TaxID=2038154 RepID=A0A8K0C8Q8_IGNLU|nr:hypothetical protein ILUMI_23132 [Ignelater luminosus]
MQNTQLILIVSRLFLVATFEYSNEETENTDTLKLTSRGNSGSISFNQSVTEIYPTATLRETSTDDVTHRKELVVNLTVNLNGCRQNRLGRKRFSQMKQKTRPITIRNTRNKRPKKNNRRKSRKNKSMRSGRTLDFKLQEARKTPEAVSLDSKAENLDSKTGNLDSEAPVGTPPIIGRARPAINDDDKDYIHEYYDYIEDENDSLGQHDISSDINNPCPSYLTEIAPTVDNDFITNSLEFTTVMIDTLSTAEDLNKRTETEQGKKNQSPEEYTFPALITLESTTTDKSPQDETTEDLNSEAINQPSTFPVSTTLDEFYQDALEIETSRQERRNEPSSNEFSRDKTTKASSTKTIIRQTSTSPTVGKSYQDITVDPSTLFMKVSIHV